MRGSERQNHASSSVLGPSSGGSSPSSITAPSPARVTLPSDLAGSLKYLDDAQLGRLLEAVSPGALPAERHISSVLPAASLLARARSRAFFARCLPVGLNILMCSSSAPMAFFTRTAS